MLARTLALRMEPGCFRPFAHVASIPTKVLLSPPVIVNPIFSSAEHATSYRAPIIHAAIFPKAVRHSAMFPKATFLGHSYGHERKHQLDQEHHIACSCI